MPSLRYLQPIGRACSHGNRPPIRILPSLRSLPRHYPSRSAVPRFPHRSAQQIRPLSQTARHSYNPNKWHHPHDDPRYKLAQAKPLVTGSSLGRFARSGTTRTVAVIAVAAAVLFYFSNMQTVPVSGRRRFNCFSESFVEAVAQQQVKRIVWEVEHQGGRFLGDWDPRTRMVKRVMARLIPVSGMEDAEWEVRVIDDPRMYCACSLPTLNPLGGWERNKGND